MLFACVLCACLHMCIVWPCMHICAHAHDARGQCWVSSSTVFPLILLIYLCVCVWYMYVFMWHTHMCKPAVVCVYTELKRLILAVFFSCFSASFFFYVQWSLTETGAHQCGWTGWPVSLRSVLSSLLPWCRHYSCTPWHLTFYVSVGDLNSGPHACDKHFTNWSITPAHCLFSLLLSRSLPLDRKNGFSEEEESSSLRLNCIILNPDSSTELEAKATIFCASWLPGL